MLDLPKLKMDDAIDLLKAAGETTRMRLLILLSHGDLTVSDLTEILGQSQPRISRHLKLLGEAGLIERYQEGAWAYFRLIDEGRTSSIIHSIIEAIAQDDRMLQHDVERLKAVKSARAGRAQEYFSQNAEKWGEIRKHHVSEAKVEAELCKLVGNQPFDSLLDLGTGTGRILELFKDQYRKGLGIDASRDMLTIARDKLDQSGITHASVRQGDIFNLALERESYDLIVIHQVLHFLHDPAPAINEACKMLAPGGRLVIIDFAPHELEYMRSDFAHARLGFSHESVSGWMTANGLDVEKISDLSSDNSQDKTLTVSIWLGKDPRILMAGDNSASIA